MYKTKFNLNGVFAIADVAKTEVQKLQFGTEEKEIAQEVGAADGPAFVANLVTAMENSQAFEAVQVLGEGDDDQDYQFSIRATVNTAAAPIFAEVSGVSVFAEAVILETTQTETQDAFIQKLKGSVTILNALSV